MIFVSRETFGSEIDWPYFVNALESGHKCAKPQIADVFLGPPGKIMLSRAAYIEGFGYGVKSVTAMAGNAERGLPTVQGAMIVFDPDTGSQKAIIDSGLITDIKTASDSALGAQKLARPDSKTLMVVGAGSVAKNVIAAFCATLKDLDTVLIWNRTPQKAKHLADEMRTEKINVQQVDDLQAATAKADIISTATMSNTPVLPGDWVNEGTHIDLIGAFTADMRETDDDMLRKARLFVDSRETTLHHIGELKIPLANDVITESDILADHYDLVSGFVGRNSNDDITVFKNGGGAHLDLMIAQAILEAPNLAG